MKVLFRVDASEEIGSGHVMRCLTIAEALSQRGGQCSFICREHKGHLIESITAKGYVVHRLPESEGGAPPGTTCEADTLSHAHWLGVSQAQDAGGCVSVATALRPDWLIVDHYGLDRRWENALAPFCRKMMVIDDLADRPHVCDLLLDQGLGRQVEDYGGLVNAECRLVLGSRYALLRPEFAALRAHSLARRRHSVPKNLLVAMGGVDKTNVTGEVLEALRFCELAAESEITVVLGTTAPWVDEVRRQASDMPWPTRVLVGTANMANLMADSDIAIGAAGTTSWERCCLGLPTLMLVLAHNQCMVAQSLARAGAARLIDRARMTIQLRKSLDELLSSESDMSAMSVAAAAVADGSGLAVVSALLAEG